MTLTETIAEIFSKKASSPAQRAVNAGAPDAAENPTEGQKRVGNYRKVHLNLDGFRISIENPKGSVRSGTSPDGTKWSNTLACDYGDIRGTESVDGDPVDIYLSDHPEKGAVFVIDQIDPKTGKFDEHKVMYGFDSIEDAKNTYLACYQKGWKGLGWITPVSKSEFRKWIDSSTRKTKPFHEYQSVNPIVDPIKVNEKAAASSPVYRWHSVVAGDNLTNIAKRYGTTWQILAALNNIKNPNQIMVGHRIKYPYVEPVASTPELRVNNVASTPESRFNNISSRLHSKLNNSALEAAILANFNRETGGTFDYKQKEIGGGGYGIPQYTGDSLKKYRQWLIDSKLTDSADSQIDYFVDKYMPSRYGYKMYTAPNAKYTKEEYADWAHRRVFTPAHTIKGNSAYNENTIKKHTDAHNAFMKDRMKQVDGVWKWVPENKTKPLRKDQSPVVDPIKVNEKVAAYAPVDEFRKRIRNIMRRRRPELQNASDAEVDKAADEEYAKLIKKATAEDLEKQAKWGNLVRRPLGFILSNEPSYAKWAAEHPEEVAEFERAQEAMKSSIDKAASAEDDNKDHPIPEEMKKKFPIGKWVSFPHARMPGKVRKIVGYFYGGTRDNGKDYYCCWLESPDRVGKCYHKCGLAMYGGYGDHPRPVFDNQDEAQKYLDDEETASGYRAKQEEIANEQEKTAQAIDDDGLPPGVKLRSFIDAPATRTAIMDNVLEAVKNRFPVEDDDVKLELRDVKYEGPTSYTLQQQKDALLNNRRLGCRIAGTWRLTDKRTGQVLDERRDGVLRVPYYTDRGTIINNGNEYTVISQARLSPGVYVRRKQNGELESQFNVANGLGFRIGLDKETGALNMSIGQGHVPLYPVLHALGVSDEDMRKSWGSEVTNVNIGKFDPRAIDKVYARYAGRRADMSITPQEKAAFISEALSKSGLDPDVVTRTLGLENVNGVTGAVMLRAAQKLLNINRGAEDPDERDNPRFSKFFGVEDMMRERIDRDSGRLTKSLLFRAKRDKNLGRIARNALAPYLDTFLSGSGLAMPGEEANPLSILTQQSRITRLGEGGISSPDLVTPEARNVQGDYLGYVDFISGPESFGIGIDVRASLGTMKGSDNRLYNKMVDLRTGKTRYVALNDAAAHTVAFPGQDPNAPQLYAMRKGVPTMVPREEVDFMVPGFGNTVSAGINMTPMPTAVQAGRQFYMSKFWEQYLPQKKGEIPLVDSLMDDGKTTYSEFYGRKIGCLTAPFSGTVTKVTDDEITIRGKDGQTHTASLVKGLPFNRMSSISFTPQVKKGDEVDEGGLLANSNFTDAKTGAMNMGRNLKVAVLPAPEGASSFEDAIVISESAAKKLATSRTYNFETEQKDGVKIARNQYLAAFPKAYTKEQADTIDDNGVVKVGTVLHRDDPMILAIGPKMLSGEDAQLGRLSGVLRNALTDKSTKWEHDWPGVVTDVVYGPNGAKVLVNSEPPVKVGDKLSGEMGLKGVVGCYDSSTEVLTIDGWKCWTDVTMSDKLAVLPTGMGGLADFAHPTALYAYDFDGCLLHAHTEQLDYRVTSNHRMYCRIDHYRGHTAQYRIRTAEDIFGKKVTHLCAAEFDYNNRDTVPFDLSHYVDYDSRHERKKAKTVFDGEDFAELLGWYISEGNVAVYHGTGVGRSRHDVNSYKIQISQSRTTKPKNCERLEALLNRMGIKWHYHGLQYTFASKPLYMLLVQLGLSNEKHLPEFVKLFSKRQIIRLFEGLMLGDGSVRERKTVRSGLDYITTSPRLARQVEFIMTMLGYNAVIQVESRAGKKYHNKGRAKPCNYNFDKYTVCAKSLTELGQSTAESTRELYKGKVYCASVPGGLLYVRRNGRPMWCGNSILPDDKMPRDAVTNETYDMLMNPMGFLSRVAPGQIMLMNLAKVAKKTGKQLRIPQTPPPEGWQAYTERLMSENGVNETADVFDPQTGRTIKNVGDGYVYTKAFHHLAEKKFSARGVDGAYTMDEQPAKGGEDGAKRVSGFDNLALLSHGATEVIKDSMITRGQMNDEYWRRYRLGLPVEEPGVPFIYQKFINTLRAGGVNVVEKGDVTSIMPQTDKDIDELSQGRVLENSQMVDADMVPVKGGMFDLGKTGGMGGDRWSMITLPEAVPNPMMEEPVRRVLGLTAKKMEAILSGREELDGKTGGDAIKEALGKVNVDREIEKARADVQNRRGSQRDNAIKVLGYLKAAKEMGMNPQDWMISRVPVLPPMFRPVAKMGDVALVPDMNELYKELIEMKQNYEMLAKELPASALAEERLSMYGAVKAAYGLGDSITTEGRAKNLKGAIRQVIGTIPKFGMYQSKVVSKTQDSVGRSVTVPDKNLDMDQVGIPEDMAWEMYKPHVERKLAQRGYSPVTAKNMIEERNATARHLLDDVMAERPILMDRAPTWHKFNIMAFRPHIVHGRSIHVSPIIDSGFNMDHDGDTVNIHVPASEKAAKQALEKMLPSKNLFSLTDLKSVRYKPEKEQISGLWALTRGKTKKPVRVFASKAEAIKAYRNGEIGPNDPVEIADMK